MDLEKLRLAKDVLVIGTSLVIIFVLKHMIGFDFLEGWGDVFIGASLVMAVLAAGLGFYFRSLLLARMVFFVGLTLVLVFSLGPEAFNRGGDLGIGVLLVLLVVAVPVVAYLCRPSVRAELPILWHLCAGSRAVSRGDFVRAEDCARKALACAAVLHSNRSLSLAMALGQLGTIYRTEGRWADAASAFEEALSRFDEASPSQPVLRANATLHLAATYISQGRFAEAEPLCRQILLFSERGPRTIPETKAAAWLNLGQILAGQENYREAENLTRQALELLANQVERGEPTGCIALAYLADLCRRQERLSEAEPLARRALALSERVPFGPEHPTLCRFLNVLAEIVRLQGWLDEAEAFCRRSQTLTEKSFGTEHPSLDSCLATVARIRMTQGRYAEAEQLFRRCLSILEQAVVPEHPELVTRREEYKAVLQKINGEVTPGAEG